MINRCCLGLYLAFFLTLPFLIYAQTSYRISNESEVDALLADLADRSRVLPTDEFLIFSERDWVNVQLNTISPILAQLNTPLEITTELDSYMKEWNRVEGEINDLNPDNLPELNKFLSGSLQASLSRISNFAFSNDLESEQTYQNFLDFVRTDLADVYQGNQTEEIQDSNRAKVVYETISAKLPPIVKSLLAQAQNMVETREDERLSLKTKLEDADARLKQYRATLTDQLTKLQTKKSLSSNLYLMILIIGGLSVLSIALVRLFPDNVMLEWVESGQVIQFVTVMILLSAIMALGLAGLLSENTLGTLLGGIGGYVLAQGVGRAVARTALKSMNESGGTKTKDPRHSITPLIQMSHLKNY